MPGQLYVGMKDHVEVFNPKGERIAIWPSQGTEAYYTSIAAADYEIWVADAGNRVVWCYDLHGKPLSPLGKAGSPAGAEFIVANHYFNVAMGRDDLLYVVNPGLLRVEAYTRNGDRERRLGARARRQSPISSAAAIRLTSPCCPRAISSPPKRAFRG